ncbi:serine hydrolase domain-containing protein [Pseudogemmobacter sonorensis]|uniref:serine hydrolase domain-containing protein n=1 Tax=Pseudogemmobacter sonorensis TaxID=2989681 RepID=UPI0036D1E495
MTAPLAPGPRARRLHARSRPGPAASGKPPRNLGLQEESIPEIQSILDRSVARGDLPFAVGICASSDRTIFSGAAGEAAPGLPAAPDTVIRAFSATKGVCATAMMLLVDRGKLDIETPVEEILPEFARIQVLERIENGVPVLRRPKVRATIRHLATHSSGLEHDFWNQDVMDYVAATGHPGLLDGKREALFYPMMTDPGTRWAYSMGPDWIGLVIEAIDGRRIEDFAREEVLIPLGMHDTDVHLRTPMAERLAGVSARNDAGDLVPTRIDLPVAPEIFPFGSSLYTTAADYIRLLRMLLGRGVLEGTRLMRPETVDFMLQDHLNGLGFRRLRSVAPAFVGDVDFFEGTRKSHSLGFFRNDEDIPGMRRAGSQSWAGVCNNHFWFDPKSDLAAVLFTQSLPFLDPRYMQTYQAFERAVYAG